MKNEIKHPELRMDECMSRYHRRCEAYHLQRRTELMAQNNYRDAGHHSDLSAIHAHHAAYLESKAIPMREMTQDEKDDTIVGR